MSQLVFNITSGGRVLNEHTNYYTCRNATTGTSAGGQCLVGQLFFKYDPVIYKCYRGFIFFDASPLPEDAIIISATISLPIAWDYSDNDFNVILRSADNVNDPIVVEDYDLTKYDSENFADVSGYTAFTLNDLGLAHIKRAGITKFVLLSKKDINSEPPTLTNPSTGFEYVQYSYTNSFITITFFAPTEIPTVETIDEECEDRQSTTLTAVGEITGTGDGYTFRGFEYHEYDPEYDSSMYAVREIGRFHELGEFRMTLYGLKPATVYSIRAFAGNVFGIGYGEWILCSTTGVQVGTYDVYTEPNTAKYRLYVSDDEAIAWRGYKGPYSGKQTLINIKDITNLTKGMKVLKIDLPEAGKKGNFHICITVKQTLKG